MLRLNPAPALRLAGLCFRAPDKETECDLQIVMHARSTTALRTPPRSAADGSLRPDQIDDTHWNIDCMYSSVIAFDET